LEQSERYIIALGPLLLVVAMGKGFILLCVSFYIVLLTYGKEYHPIPTFFHRRDEHGKIIDVNQTDFQMSGPFNNVIDRKNLEATLKVWPEEVDNAGIVTILWQGIQDPDKSDRIGYYCPYLDRADHALDYICNQIINLARGIWSLFLDFVQYATTMCFSLL